jgi:hypothetical protein
MRVYIIGDDGITLCRKAPGNDLQPRVARAFPIRKQSARCCQYPDLASGVGRAVPSAAMQSSALKRLPMA